MSKGEDKVINYFYGRIGREAYCTKNRAGRINGTIRDHVLSILYDSVPCLSFRKQVALKYQI